MSTQIATGLRAFGVAGVLLAMVNVSFATPLDYDEFISGDIPGDGTIASINTTFELDAGTNTVTGQWGWGSGSYASLVDADHFRFVIPADSQLTGMSIAWGNVQVYGNIVYSNTGAGITTCGILNEEGTAFLATAGSIFNRCINYVASPSGNLQLFGDALPLTAGPYIWFHSLGIGWNGELSDDSIGWTLVIDRNPI